MGIAIRELSERSGVKVPTIRYYEQQGLLPEPERTGTGQRRYGSVDIARLRFVRFGRGLGLEVGEIRSLIEMVGEGNGEEIVVLAESVAQRAERMRVLSETLRSVSLAIIAGGIDETETFDRLMAGEGAELEQLAEIPPAPGRDAAEAPEGHALPPTEMTGAEDEASMGVEPVAEEPTEEVAAERDAPEFPLSKPKRRRTRAKS